MSGDASRATTRTKADMDTIKIADLEVFYHVGVPDQERVTAQRLLLTVEMEHDISAASSRDDLAGTIDYFSVCQRLLRFGEGRQWRLIETLAAEIAAMILKEFKPDSVAVEVKKFVIPQAAHVSVRLQRSAN